MSVSAILGVMAGGALGALCRYLTSFLVQGMTQGTAYASFPFATLLVNVVGSFLLSTLFHANTSNLSPTLQIAVGAGFLGSFTTFSTFELDNYRLVQAGQWGWAGAYLFGNLLLGFAAILLGRFAAHRLF